MEWSQWKILKLIDLYRLRPVLWNPSHVWYKQKHRRNDATEEIAIELGVTASEITRKIAVILSQHRRCRSRMRMNLKTGAEEVESTPAWFAFKHLDFLRNKNLIVDTNVNDSVEKENDDVTIDFDLTQDSPEQQNIEIDLKNTFEGEGSQMSQKRKGTPKKMVRKSEEDSKIEDLFEILRGIYKKDAEPADPNIAFAQHVAVKMSQFDPITRAKIEFKMHSIIYKAELKALKHKRAKTSDGYSSSSSDSDD